MDFLKIQDNSQPVSSIDEKKLSSGALFGNNVTGGPYTFYKTPRTAYQESYGFPLNAEALSQLPAGGNKTA